MTYAQTIQAVLDDFAVKTLTPREVEASMRLQYATLDHLPLETFAHEVVVALEMLGEGADLNALADSFGLPR